MQTTDASAELPNPASSRRLDWIICAALVVLAAIAFGDVLAGSADFYMRDLTRYYYPVKQLLRDIVSHGEFPYWNRYFSGGQPIAANPEHEVFYPLTWLILLPSYDLGYRLHILVHIWIALVGMYALLRSMEMRPAAAVFGSVTWGLGGLFMSYVNLLPIMFCAAWLPLTCLYVRRFLLRRNARDFALASLFLGLQFLVGEPTTIMQTGLLLGMYGLYRAWHTHRRIVKSISRTLWVAAISVAGLLVGAAQVLPALDLVQDSARSRSFDFDLVSAWSMPWAKFAELFFPNVLGHMSIGRVTWYWGGGLYPGMGSPFVFSIYCGLLVIALTIGGAFARIRGGRMVLITAVVSTLMAVGSHTPVLKWLYRAGIVASIRYPEKFILLGIFAMLVFAASALDQMLSGNESVREGALGFAAAIIVVSAIVCISGFTPFYAKAISKVWVLTPSANTTFIIKTTRHDWLLVLLRGAAVAALLITARTRYRRTWLAALVLLTLADILPIAEEVNPRMPRSFFDPPPAAAMLPPNHADYRLFHEADWYGQEETARKYFSTASSVYWIVRDGLFPMTPAGSRIQTVLERDYDKTALLPTVDLVDSVWDVKRSGRKDWFVPFMAMSNAWFRAEYRGFASESKRVKGDFTKAIPISFTPAPHYPRYYFADQIVTIASRDDFVKKLSHESFSPRVAFVRQPSFVPGNGVVRGMRESANSAVIDVDSDGQSFLVMSVTPHKYWSVTVDGLAVTPVVTNIAYQGVVITPGHHRIVMRYANPLVEIGGGISAGAFLLLLLLAVLRRRTQLHPTDITAYEEPIHIVSDAEGTHLEPAPLSEEQEE